MTALGSQDAVVLSVSLPASTVELMDAIRIDDTGVHCSRPCSREDYVRASVDLRLLKAVAVMQSEREEPR